MTLTFCQAGTNYQEFSSLSFSQNNSTFISHFTSKETAILGQEGNKNHLPYLAKIDFAHGSNLSRLQEMWMAFQCLSHKCQLMIKRIDIILLKNPLGKWKSFGGFIFFFIGLKDIRETQTETLSSFYFFFLRLDVFNTEELRATEFPSIVLNSKIRQHGSRTSNLVYIFVPKITFRQPKRNLNFNSADSTSPLTSAGSRII